MVTMHKDKFCYRLDHRHINKLKESSTVCSYKITSTILFFQSQCLKPAAIWEIKFNTYDVIFESAVFQQKGAEVYPVFLKNQTF